MYKIINQSFKIKYNYNILFSNNIFNTKNKLFINLFNLEDKNKKKIIIFIDKNVYASNKCLLKKIKKFFEKYKNYFCLISHPILITGGEKIKNHYILVKCLYKIVDKYKICRQSYIISIGGGSFQDLIGYVSSTAHRGIRLIRFPTTVLSQDDSGVGVKNGINFFGKKNFIGCFSVPFVVINDYIFLRSLKKNVFLEGFSEAIKVALIKDEELFIFLEKNTLNLIKRKRKYIEHVIFVSAKLHADHISKNGDPFEITSSRPLDFGHWVAHKIESLSKYKISHGSAVSIGIALDCVYSYFIKLLSKIECKRILKTLFLLTLPIYTDFFFIKKNNKYILFLGIEEFREHLGGRLTITLIKKIGEKIDVHHVNTNFYLKSMIFLKKLNKRIKNDN